MDSLLNEIKTMDGAQKAQLKAMVRRPAMHAIFCLQPTVWLRVTTTAGRGVEMVVYWPLAPLFSFLRVIACQGHGPRNDGAVYEDDAGQPSDHGLCPEDDGEDVAFRARRV